MLFLAAGLVLFLGVHSISLFAAGWREAQIAKFGLQKYSGLYALASIAGMILLIWGFGITRLEPIFVWHPPRFLMHLGSLMVWVAMVLITAAYVPGNRIKKAVGHPMVLGVKVWAFAHLLANGRLGDIILFGAFLIWAIVYYVIMRKRDRLQGDIFTEMDTHVKADVGTFVMGTVIWLVIALFLHRPMIGVAPFG